MQHERFVVKFIIANNCFVQLPDVWLRRLETKENVIEILHNGKIYYLSCIPRMNIDKTLCIGATFAKNLNIQEEDEVFVSSVKNVPTLNSIKIAPRTTTDLELLQLLKDRVQSNLLNEVRIVAKGQPIVAWISKFSSVTFTMEDSEPKFAYGLLEQFTEVHVLDTIANSKMENVNQEATNISNPLAKISSYFTKEKDHRHSKDNAANHALLQRFRKKSAPCVFRVYPLPKFQSFDQSNAYDLILRCPFYILIPRNCLPKGAESTNGKMCKIKKILENWKDARTATINSSKDEPLSPKNSSRDNFFVSNSSQKLVARIYILEDILEKCSALDREYFDVNSIHCGVYVSDSLRINLGLKVGCRVIAEMIEEDEQPKASLIDILPSNESITTEVFRSYVKIYSKHEALLLNTCSMISLDDDNRCIIKMLPEECNYATIDEKDMRNLTIHISSPVNLNDAEILESHTKKSSNLEKISRRCMESVLDECKIALDLSLGLRGRMEFLYDRENILICGGVGSGKTTVYKLLIEHYCVTPYFVYTFVINCRSLRGKKVETIQPLVRSAMSECAYYQPSILFLDDLESITSASLNDEENTPEVKNASRITDMLINTVTEYQKSHYISVVATCNGISKIGLNLRPAKGMQFFRTVLQISNLEKMDRIDILRLTLEDKLCVPGDMNWNYYGNKTEGWMPQDLVDLAEKTKFVAWKRHATEKSKAPIVVTDEDINTALTNFIPMSLHGAQLYKNSEHSWSDIGGLADTKRSLMEILQWPLKYPEIFKNAPIKLQSGVLLYGMPGTGKTMLAKAIASECGVNLISIKGPELLSKYVGASEESVRNVFERARRAKPCVLFFDEFDSLASRRGEDNTGVTDRVVNQLLTQLDGVEDREGVAIVAASSRPDLLDPAILRPGRLDKYLPCPLPNETDREAIFAVSCNSQNIDQAELDLKELVQLSNGFTGADINAAITLARLSAFENALATAADSKIDAADIKVTQTQLVESVKSTKPSLSTAEKLKYEKIYARFSKGENFAEDVLKNQRVTLA